MSLGTLKPSQLATLGITGGLVQGSIFLILGLSEHRFLSLALFLVICIGGFVLMFKSTSALKAGIQNEKWPPEQIELVRSILESPWTNALVFALFAAYIILAIPYGHTIRRAIGWSLFMPMQALSQLVASVRHSAPKTQPIEWHNIAPLQSEHWGER